MNFIERHTVYSRLTLQLTSFLLVFYICVWFCGVQVPVWGCIVEARGQALVLDVLRCHSPCFLRHGLSLAWSSPDSSSLVVQQALENCLSSSPQHWGCKCVTTPSIVMQAHGIQSAPHACMASVLWTELSPHP